MQLWGSNQPADREQWLANDFTNTRGEFSLQADDTNFAYYHIWLEPIQQTYQFYAATAGPGGTVISNRQIRYSNPANGTYAGNVFTLIPSSGSDGWNLTRGNSYSNHARPWRMLGPFRLEDAAAGDLSAPLWYNNSN